MFKDMKRMRHLLLTGAIALTASMLNTACSDSDNANDGNSSWDAGKIGGSVAGTWWGEYANRKTVTLDNGKKLRGVKSVQAYTFNNDGTGTCYNYLTNTVCEPIELYGGSMDSKNGSFTWTTNADSTITITRTGDGDSENPKTWTAVLTKDGLKVKYGSKEFTSDSTGDELNELISTWETKLRTGSNSELADESFLTNWWNVGKVKLSGIDSLVWTPWGYYDGKMQSQDIPSKIRYYNSKSDGWQMCFAYLNGSSSEKTHWFGLYNSNTAVMRVFFYVDNSAEFGNELFFDCVSSDDDLLKYPLYHAMEYGIPANHTIEGKTLRKNCDLNSASCSKSNSWEWNLSPYSTYSEATGVDPGWHVVDYDLSAYVPSETSWVDGITDDFKAYFKISPKTQKTSNVTLTGALTGNISGEIETYKTEIQTSSGNSAQSTASSVFSILGNTCSSVGMAGMQTMMMTNKPNTKARQFNTDTATRGVTRSAGGVFAGFSWAGVGLSLISSILSATNTSTTTTTYIDTIPSKVDLSVDCDIDLSGEITSWESVNASPIEITRGLLEDSNDSIIIGQGLWSLADDPVIYIDTEDILSSSSYFTVKATKDGYKYTGFDEDSVRLVSFLDPHSIKVNLNTDVYHNIKNVTVLTGYGVTYNESVGHTDCYRTLMYLDDRPTFKFYDSASEGDLIRAKKGSLSSSEQSAGYKLAKQYVIQLEPQEMASWYDPSFWEQRTDNEYADFKFVDQTMAKSSDNTIHYLGPTLEVLGTKKVVFPQVFVAYDDNGNISYPESPDFFVWVDVAFECKEGKVEFIKQFIPQVKLIDHETTCSKYQNIVDYINKCDNGESYTTLANDKNIKVTAGYASEGFTPIKKMLEKVKNR